jgi:hypothetical protein
LNCCPATRRQDGDEDRNDQRPDPHHQSLLDSVEPRHASCHVTAAVVGEEQDNQQHNDAHQANGAAVRGGLVYRLVDVRIGGKAHSCSGRGHQGRQEHGHAGGGQPAKERRAHLDTAELLLFAGHSGLPVRQIRINGRSLRPQVRSPARRRRPQPVHLRAAGTWSKVRVESSPAGAER